MAGNPGINNIVPQTGKTYKSDGTTVNVADYAGSIVKAYYEGTSGADIPVTGTGIILTNDTSETILVTINGIAGKIKSGETLDENFVPFTSITIDPTTSLGAKQIETATLAVGNVTTAGVMAVIVTAAGMAGTPKTILVPVALTDTTPTLIMTKVRAALAADAAVSALFTVGGSGAVLTLTAIRGRANDESLNVDLGGTGTTAVGITRVASSADTEAGVAATAIGYRLWVRG